VKVVLLAGGYGTRFGRLTEFLPKPMIPIGPMPIVWHIMQHYIQAGHKEFIICTGYKSDLIKEFFLNLDIYSSDFTLDFRDDRSPQPKFVGTMGSLDAQITLCYTGLDTMTGGRLSRVREFLNDDEHFMLTYGDGVSDVPIRQLVDFHEKHGKLATLTAVHPPPKFGNLQFEGDQVTSFAEKTGRDGALVNGGFYVFRREFLDLVDDDVRCVLERRPLETAAATGQLMAFRYRGFWQCMDTSRDMETLQELWNSDQAPWRTWGDNGYHD